MIFRTEIQWILEEKRKLLYSQDAILYSQNAILYSQDAILYSQDAIFFDVDFINNFDIDWSSKWLQAIILGVNEF